MNSDRLHPKPSSSYKLTPLANPSREKPSFANECMR